MMKRMLTLSLVLLFGAFVPASTSSDEHILCAFDGKNPNGQLSLVQGSPVAQQRVADILNVVGLQKNFNVMAATVGNAGALIQGSNRYILYNPYFMADVNNKYTDWSTYSILAHEIGHHLNGHTIQRSNGPSQELEADEFSGFVLRKMGATLKEAQAAMANLAPEESNRSHPGKALRLAAIEKGWKKADQQMRR